MQPQNEIFLDNEQHLDSNPFEQIKYIRDTESDNYINQFLWQDGVSVTSKIQHESAPILLQNFLQLSKTNTKPLGNHKNKPKRKKSLFHNFQKHLVITLKKIVRIKAKPEDFLIGKIGEQMWNIFVKSHLYTKAILQILYGTEQQQEECSLTSAMLNRFGFVELFNKYSEDLVKEGQIYLRHETVKALKSVNLKQYLGQRRLAKAEEFEDYLNQFIEELSEGPIKRRIPKQKKKMFLSYRKSTIKSKQ